MKDALAAKGIAVQSAELTRIASLLVPVTEREAEQVLRLVDALEDHEDVQRVHANFSVPDELMARIAR